MKRLTFIASILGLAGIRTLGKDKEPPRTVCDCPPPPPCDCPPPPPQFVGGTGNLVNSQLSLDPGWNMFNLGVGHGSVITLDNNLPFGFHAWFYQWDSTPCRFEPGSGIVFVATHADGSNAVIGGNVYAGAPGTVCEVFRTYNGSFVFSGQLG